MGKFDGFLLLSDIDGTFVGGDNIPMNCEAARYFTDNGGRFAFATGRTTEHLRQPQFFHLINAPCCLYNGGAIYDYARECVLREGHADFTVREFLQVIAPKKDLIGELWVFPGLEQESVKTAKLDSLSEKVLDCRPIKLVCVFEDRERADVVKLFAREQALFRHSYIGKAWNEGLEFNDLNATKGSALDFIKEYLGNIHTTVGIGDQENDVPLVRHADIGVAMGNAVEDVKRAADMIVKPCHEYGFCELIERLDRIVQGR